jgi:mannose-6-phosphate isomerase-like protein (cupin superfamily)
MVTQQTTQPQQQQQGGMMGRSNAYNNWLKDEGVLVHTGYYIEDVRTLPLARWDRAGCDAAFLTLSGQEGISEAHVIEIPPGQSLPPFKLALEQVAYVVQGMGLTTISGGEGLAKNTFEWQAHSMFYIPANATYQLVNAKGTEAARILIMTSLPEALRLIPDAHFFFDNPYANQTLSDGSSFYQEAKAQRTVSNVVGRPGETYTRNQWTGAFFPDMRAWDKLDPFKGRGAGGQVVNVRFPNAATWAHMSVFPAQTYKKAHRHGPGVVIVIPAGEGYSVMWPEGKEKVFIHWHEASVFVPPNMWFHQHFNVGDADGRYLALHPSGQTAGSERVSDPSMDQIEYPSEEPIIREYFEEQLAKRGLKSNMPEQAYKDPKYEWDYGPDN